jgi:hypothetical protein
MAVTPKVFAPTPLCAQGDTEDNPKPVPNINMISDRAAAPAAPAIIAPHDTALACARSSVLADDRLEDGITFGIAMMPFRKLVLVLSPLRNYREHNGIKLSVSTH